MAVGGGGVLVGGCVTNPLSSEVGVAVYSNVGEARGSDTNMPGAVGVAGKGVSGVRDGGLPPGGVGV